MIDILLTITLERKQWIDKETNKQNLLTQRFISRESIFQKQRTKYFFILKSGNF